MSFCCFHPILDTLEKSSFATVTKTCQYSMSIAFNTTDMGIPEDQVGQKQKLP